MPPLNTRAGNSYKHSREGGVERDTPTYSYGVLPVLANARLARRGQGG